MSKHTPEPWFTELGSREVRYKGPHYTGIGDLVARTFIGEGSHAQAEANARLIAAAPELAEALQAIYADLESGFIAQDSVAAERNRRKVEEKARAALAKAGLDHAS